MRTCDGEGVRLRVQQGMKPAMIQWSTVSTHAPTEWHRFVEVVTFVCDWNDVTLTVHVSVWYMYMLKGKVWLKTTDCKMEVS